nr:MAG TPA: hypothetical protein [Caudoviricetes sp.]
MDGAAAQVHGLRGRPAAPPPFSHLRHGSHTLGVDGTHTAPLR